LSSMRQSSMSTWASRRLSNCQPSRNSARSRPLNDSIQAFCQGEPGSMKRDCRHAGRPASRPPQRAPSRHPSSAPLREECRSHRCRSNMPTLGARPVRPAVRSRRWILRRVACVPCLERRRQKPDGAQRCPVHGMDGGVVDRPVGLMHDNERGEQANEHTEGEDGIRDRVGPIADGLAGARARHHRGLSPQVAPHRDVRDSRDQARRHGDRWWLPQGDSCDQSDEADTAQEGHRPHPRWVRWLPPGTKTVSRRWGHRHRV
jgi:hypothetical protein